MIRIHICRIVYNTCLSNMDKIIWCHFSRCTEPISLHQQACGLCYRQALDVMLYSSTRNGMWMGQTYNQKNHQLFQGTPYHFRSDDVQFKNMTFSLILHANFHPKIHFQNLRKLFRHLCWQQMNDAKALLLTGPSHKKSFFAYFSPPHLFLFTFPWAKFSYLLKWKPICLMRRFFRGGNKFRNDQASYMLSQLKEANSPYLHVYTFILQETQGMRVRLHAIHFLATSFLHMKP